MVWIETTTALAEVAVTVELDVTVGSNASPPKWSRMSISVSWKDPSVNS
jgi:hypothetical protein